MLQYLVSIGTLAAITGMLTLGLNYRWGLGGQLDLGFYLFVALGAYVDGVLTLPAASTQPGVHYILGLGLPFVVGFLGAGIFTGLLSKGCPHRSTPPTTPSARPWRSSSLRAPNRAPTARVIRSHPVSIAP